MTPFPRVAIVGLGLIGGSLAERIRTVYPNTTISAMDPNAATLKAALTSTLIDEVVPESGDFEADLVIVATPMDGVVPTIQSLAKRMSKPTVFTDVASIKSSITPGPLPNGHVFIPGHPIAGSEKTGFDHRFSVALVGAPYVLVPTDTPVFSPFKNWIQTLGFRVVEMSAPEHDERLAATSHFPFLVASLLVDGVRTHHPAADLAALVGPGFRDSTRVASGNPQWGASICKSNSAHLQSLLVTLSTAIDTLSTAIADGDAHAIETYFKGIKHYRDSLFPG